MKLKNSRWMMVALGVIPFLVLGTMVWASPPPDGLSAPLQATPGLDADKIDGHHAYASYLGTGADRQYKVLWANKWGRLDWEAMPGGTLNARFVNDDRVESMTASSGQPVLTVHNTGSGRAVRGVSGGHDGVVGETSVAGRSGVYGYNSGGGYGVTGRSAAGFGLNGDGAGDGSGTDLMGDLVLGGTRGEIFTFGNYLNLYSNYNVNIDLDNNNNNANATFTIWNGAEGQVFEVNEAGNVWKAGTVSALVQTESYGQRLLYAMESPEVWHEDFGTAWLVEGVATVTIEPIFAETVNLEEDYHVFLTPLGDCNGLYVAAKTSTSFEVRELGGGTDSVAFDYRVVAKRLGYEDIRLEGLELSAGIDGNR